MNTYFARQPILDKNQLLHGYELLFRPDPKAETSGDIPIRDGDSATASVLNAVSQRGLSSVTGGKRAFVNFTGRLLLEGIPTLYPKEYLTVEVLESVKTTEALIDAILDLRQRGYTIALDDYIIKKDNEKLLDLADIIKVEVNEDERSIQNIRKVAAKINRRKSILLAEKVETKEMFEVSKALGCSLFQGYFFARPVTELEYTVSSLRINHLRLIREVSHPHVDFGAIADIIKQDTGLSYKILRLVNSAYFGLRNEVKSIHQAVVYLGTTELKKWVSFVTLTGICMDKPSELILMSLVRAHFCEMVAEAIGSKKSMDAFFLTGMFSLLPSMIDVDMKTALSGITVPAITRTALLRGGNKARYAVDLIAALERGDWDSVAPLCEDIGLDAARVPDFYYDSLQWGNAFTSDLLGG